MLSILGLIVALSLLILMTIRGMSLLVAAPLAAVIVALSGSLHLLPSA